MARYEFTQVDAFTATPFAGNPAAVVMLESAWPDDNWLQQVAAENNLSETAFLVADDGAWALRWFTPTVEVDLCGHATLASAHALWEGQRLARAATAQFDTCSGRLSATLSEDGWVELDLPAMEVEPVIAPLGLLDALGPDPLGVDPIAVGRSGEDYVVELADTEQVRALRPNLTALARVEADGICVTAPAGGDGGPGLDFVSRYFAPAIGINEDPVTGSTHCYLGPYWAQGLGRQQLRARQVSARGGNIRIAVRGDRVAIAGQAVTVIRGTLVA